MPVDGRGSFTHIILLIPSPACRVATECHLQRKFAVLHSGAWGIKFPCFYTDQPHIPENITVIIFAVLVVYADAEYLLVDLDVMQR